MPTIDLAVVQVRVQGGGSDGVVSWSGSDGGDGTGSGAYTGGGVTTIILEPGPGFVPSVVTAIAFHVTVSSSRVGGGTLYVNNGVTDTPNGDLILAFSPLYWPPNDTYPLYVQFNGSGSTSFAFAMTAVTLHLTYPVELTAIDPAQGGTLGGDPVTLTGVNFMEGCTVTFDGLPATDIDVVDDHTLTCVIPAHAVAAVDVEVTWPDASTATLTAGFAYSAFATTPLVEAGPPQIVIGPPPVTLTTTATVTRGLNNGTLTYAWELTSTPGPTPAISDPTALNTDIAFDTYAPGVYEFTLTVTTDDSGVAFAVTGIARFVIGVTVAPRVQSGHASLQIALDNTTTLAPTITDDGWGGDLAYAWAQLSGPDPATIDDPAAASTLITVPEGPGVYVFALTVSRTGDDLIGTGRWRVTVYAGPIAAPDWNDGDVTLTANGVAILGQLNSCRISKSLGANGTCRFVMFGASAEVLNDIVVARGGVRLFGGVCLSTALTFQGKESELRFYAHQCVGYAWHLGRKPITKSYTDWSISAIVLDLLSLASGGITGEFVAPGLPVITIAFVDTYIDAALNQLTNQLAGAHWTVDDFKRLHFTILEAEGDPTPISRDHPWFKDVSITRTVTQTVNRVSVKHAVVTTVPIPVDGEIQVSSLDGYAPGGGVTTIGGNTIHYTGTKTATVGSLFGTCQVFFSVTEIDATPGFPAGTGVGYSFTLTTAQGETGRVSGGSGRYTTAPEKGFRVTFTQFLGTPDQLARLTGVNVYRSSNEGAGQDFYVGTISPHGGHFDDVIPLADIDTFLVASPASDTSGIVTHYLTGCWGTLDTRTDAVVTENDVAAQADLAARLGGSDDGVIAITLQGGDISAADARAVALAYLAAAKDLSTSVGVTVRDDLAVPGHTLSVWFPDPIAVDEDLTIQSAELSGFQMDRPHEYVVAAARDRVTLEDLLRRIAP